MQACGVQSLGGWIEGALNHIRVEDVSAVRVWISKEIGERYYREREVVGVGGCIEFNHYK